MIMKANKQIGFIYKNEESIDKILKDGDVVFERGFLREKTSTTLPITFGGVGKDLKDYKVYGNTVQSKLPSGYTQVDYIESSGTQYINTNIVPTNTTKVEIKYQIKIVQNTYVSVFGSRDNNVNFFVNNGGGNTITYYWHGTGSAIARIGNFSQTTFNISTMDALNGLVKNYNNETEEELSETVSFTSFPNLPMYIFARNNDGMPSYATLGMKCWYMKIYDNNALVRDFIPCYRNSDNEVGLYDLVNNVFYTNQGTGVFTYGSVAPTPDTPIEMISCGDRTKNMITGLRNSTSNYINFYFDKDMAVNNMTVSGIFTYTISNFTIFLQTSFGNDSLLTNQSCTQNEKFSFDIQLTDTQLENIVNSTTTPSIQFYRSNQMSGIGYSEMMLRASDTTTEYEPYGKYKIPVNVRSDNLFDKDNATILNAYIGASNSKITALVSYRTTYLKVKPNTYYTVSKNSSNDLRIGLSTNNSVDIGDILTNVARTTTDNKLTILTNNDTKTLAITYAYTTVDDELKELNSLMVEEGSTASSKYIPYYNQTTNIYLDEPLRKIDEYSDYIDFVNGKIVRQLGEVVLNGSEDWTTIQAYGRNYYAVAISNLLISNSGSNDALLYNNYYIGYKSNELVGNNTKDYGICRRNNNSQVLFRDKDQSILSDLTTWLSTHNNIMCYPLSTPTEESITLPNIPTIDGNNTLNIETEITPSQVYIKYKSNT